MNRDELLDTLRRSFDGEAWHGPAVNDALKGVSETDAARRPPGGAHSIWEITLHIAAWANEVAERLRGREPRAPDEGDWPVTGGSWAEAVERVREARDNAVTAAENLTESDLEKRIGTTHDAELATGFSYRGSIEGLAQHNAYHAGQIMVLRRVIRG